MGFRKTVSGSIVFRDRNLLGLRPFQIARMGIGFAPEESEVFGELTVAENIAMPTWTHSNERSAAERINEAYNVVSKLTALRRPQRPGPVRAASARCCRLPVRSRSDPSCCCSTSRRRAFRRSSFRRLLRDYRISGPFGHAVFIAESNIHHVPDFADGFMSLNGEKLFLPGRPDEARRNPAVVRVIEGVSPAAAD